MLFWLPAPPAGIRQQISESAAIEALADRLAVFEVLVSYNLGLADIRRLAKVIAATVENSPVEEVESAGYQVVPIRILTECTIDHLVAPLLVAGMRRRILFDIEIGEYGQLYQALLSEVPERGPARFVLFFLDADRRLASAYSSGSREETESLAQEQLDEIEGLARLAAQQGEAMPVFHGFVPIGGTLFGNHEEVIGIGQAGLARLLNQGLAERARQGGLLLWSLDEVMAEEGRDRVMDVRLWRHGKMPISPDAAPLATDQLAALLGAALGRSRKVLVLDLDNTLWGGVIGDDGIDGIRLGQGSGEGESFVAFQHYAKALRNRGVLIAVSSKNTHEVCAEAIENHPEMVLKMEDFSAFRANWNRKDLNIADMAASLNLGLDSFVFFDDSPVERDLVRRELPMVAVPEVPDDPALYVSCLARAHYFDAVSFSDDDRKRHRQYAENEGRRAAMEQCQDLSEFLRSLDMKIAVQGYRPVDLARITQLVNKTNQFNLTTRRYTEAEIRTFGEDADSLLLSCRVEDRFGDNGLISVVITRPTECGEGLEIDTWLMSCRVLGRQVERATMISLVRLAADRGVKFLVGCYRPTAKNGLVRTFFADQGFEEFAPQEPDAAGATWWRLELDNYVEQEVYGSLEVSP